MPANMALGWDSQLPVLVHVEQIRAAGLNHQLLDSDVTELSRRVTSGRQPGLPVPANKRLSSQGPRVSMFLKVMLHACVLCC